MSILFIFITAVLPQTTTKTPPATRHLPPTIPTKTLVDDSEDYATLSPVINDDEAPTTSGTGDSGYAGAEEWKQYMHHPPPGKLHQIIYPCLQGYIC